MTTFSGSRPKEYRRKPAFDPSHFGAIEISPELRARFLELEKRSPSSSARIAHKGHKGRVRNSTLLAVVVALILLAVGLAILLRLAHR